MKVRHHTRRLLLALTWAGLGFAFILVVVSGFWLSYPYVVIRVNQPIDITNPNHEIRVGERIMTKTTYTKYLPLISTNYPQVACESGNLVQFKSYTSNAPVGSGTYINDDYELPPKFLDGDRCQLIVTQVYKVNPLRTVTYESRSEYFTVRERLETPATQKLREEL